MVPLAGLLEPRQIGIEVFLGEPGRAVEPLQLLAVGVPLPVGPGQARQLDRANAAGAGDVGPAAEVEKLPLPIEGELGVFGEAGLDVLNF